MNKNASSIEPADPVLLNQQQFKWEKCLLDIVMFL